MHNTVQKCSVVWLRGNCKVVSGWMRSNMLKLNPDKTHILTVGTSQRLKSVPSGVQVVMDEEDPSLSVSYCLVATLRLG